jgi:hypothetical protein
MNPKDYFAFLWKLTNCHEQLCEALKALEADCGDGPAGVAARAVLQRQRSDLRALIYALLHGGEPPVDLPDNWESPS